MSEFDDYQRRRWMRPNAHLYIRHDAYRFMPPGPPLYVGRDVIKYFEPKGDADRSRQQVDRKFEEELAAERAELLHLKSELAALWAEIKFHRLLRALKAYNPDQPRVPAGNPDGGQWSGEGASGASRVRLAAADKPRLGRAALAKIAFQLAEQAIKAYRSDKGLWDLFGRKDGAVTYSKLNGEEIFGSNSTSPTYQRIDRIEAAELRARFLEESPEKGERGQMPANAFYHAETTILLRAARRNGGTLAGQTLEVFGDRILCNNCEKILPFVSKQLGNPTVIFFDPRGERGTIRDGKFYEASRQ
jgi:hypothetical protein